MSHNFEFFRPSGDFQLYPPSGELPRAIMFSKEQRKTLGEYLGKHIVRLNPRTIQTARLYGFDFNLDWYKGTQWEAQPAMSTEAAIYLDQPYLAGTFNQTYERQQERLQQYNDSLQVAGVRAIIGTASDYVELARVLLDQRIDLFGSRYNFCSTRTSTMIEGDDTSTVTVGNYDPEQGGMAIDFRSVNNRNRQLGVVHLIVPEQALQRHTL